MIRCPKCNSEQITSQKKGFGFGKAIAGIFVAGPFCINIYKHQSIQYQLGFLKIPISFEDQ